MVWDCCPKTLLPTKQLSLPTTGALEEQWQGCSPGSLLTSHVSCFLEMLVQLRSRLTGCLLMIPLRAWGTIALHLLKSIFVQSLLSQHLWQKEREKAVNNSISLVRVTSITGCWRLLGKAGHLEGLSLPGFYKLTRSCLLYFPCENRACPLWQPYKD